MARRTPQDRMASRMADIERDYERQIARGKDPAVARAKRRQREADARDDLAQRTGGDRTATRAAEREAESALTGARRSASGRSPARRKTLEAATPARGTRANVDLGLPTSVTPAAGGPTGSSSGSAPELYATRGAAFAAARRRGDATFTYNGRSFHTRTAEEEARSNRGRGRGSGGRSQSTPAPTPAPTPAATNRPATRSGARSESTPAQRDQLRRALAGVSGATPIERSRPNSRSQEEIARALRGIGEPEDGIRRSRGGAPLGYAKGGSIKKMAKGGAVKKATPTKRSIDGIATRGKTRAPTRKK